MSFIFQAWNTSLSFLFYCVARYCSSCDEKYKTKLDEEIQELFSGIEKKLQTFFFLNVPIPHKIYWKNVFHDNIRDFLTVSHHLHTHTHTHI